MNHVVNSKLTLDEPRLEIEAVDAKSVLDEIFTAVGCVRSVSNMVAEHLVDTSLCGMESHGVMRALQYVAQFQDGYMKARSEPQIVKNDRGSVEIDGNAGIGIPAMQLAYEKGIEVARLSGVSALAVRNVGHTGRHGAFADLAAQDGFLTICVGGGNRKIWRQVAPYGGTKPMLPTNPWCVGIPGGARGPVVLDFATSKIAGGWIYAAKSAGALLPEDSVIDSSGNPTRDPNDYFDGGAILPFGGHKGYALALVGEIIGEAMLGPVKTECNWLLITLDSERFRETSAAGEIAEEILSELRSCPPAPGFSKVEIPGERERAHRVNSCGVVSVPSQTWKQVLELHKSLI